MNTFNFIPAPRRPLVASFQGGFLPSLLAVGLLAPAFVNQAPGSESGLALSNPPSCCVKETAPGKPLSDRSLYQLDSSWTNDAGAALKLVSLGGRPQIFTMFFASCEYACPLLVHDMKRIEAALPENVRTNVGFILLSFDSERDTPAALATYRKSRQLPANWTLLRGAPDDVLEIGALLGVKFKKDFRGQFAHSNVITLLDPAGEIVMQQVGLNRDPAPVAAALEKLFVPRPSR
jgi:protein SCO1